MEFDSDIWQLQLCIPNVIIRRKEETKKTLWKVQSNDSYVIVSNFPRSFDTFEKVGIFLQDLFWTLFIRVQSHIFLPIPGLPDLALADFWQVTLSAQSERFGTEQRNLWHKHQYSYNILKTIYYLFEVS